MTASNQHSERGIVALRDIADMLRKNGLLGNTGKALDKIADDLEEQLEARTNALQAIYWHGCSGFVEETIIGVLSPEERAAWAERQKDILDLLHASNPATKTCERCRHQAHEPGACGVNVGTGYQGPVPCRCGVSDPATCPLCGFPRESNDEGAGFCSHGFHAPDPASKPLDQRPPRRTHWQVVPDPAKDPDA